MQPCRQVGGLHPPAPASAQLCSAACRPCPASHPAMRGPQLELVISRLHAATSCLPPLRPLCLLQTNYVATTTSALKSTATACAASWSSRWGPWARRAACMLCTNVRRGRQVGWCCRKGQRLLQESAPPDVSTHKHPRSPPPACPSHVTRCRRCARRASGWACRQASAAPTSSNAS